MRNTRNPFQPALEPPEQFLEPVEELWRSVLHASASACLDVFDLNQVDGEPATCPRVNEILPVHSPLNKDVFLDLARNLKT